MSYLIHRALANVAQELRVVKVAIDNVVSPVLMSTCEKMGMGFGAHAGSFNSAPDALKKACDIALKRKDWAVESPNSPDRK